MIAGFRRACRRLVNAFRHGRAEDELAREIAAHLALIEDRFQQDGMTADQTRLAARRAFGGVEQAKERHRDARSFVWLDQLRQDASYAFRSMRRQAGFTVVAVATLALGIGASTAIFTIVNAVLIERPPFHDPDRIVAIWEESARRPGQHNVVSAANYLRWLERAQSFEPLAGLFESPVNLTGSDDPEQVVLQSVTAAFFPTLAVQPLLGRTFSDEENHDLDPRVVILGYDLWQRRFGGDPAIVGRVIQLNTVPVTVVGIMPRGFQLFMRASAGTGRPSDLWRPTFLGPTARERFSRGMTVVGRLRHGRSIVTAQTEMSAIAAGLAQEFPDHNAGWTATVVTVQQEMSVPYRQALLVLSGAVAFLLLIACANVANLLLVRGAARQRELAIRLALGAGRWRVARQLLTESLALAVAGGIAALPVAHSCLRVLLALNPIEFAPSSHVRLSGPVLLFATLLSILTALICGVAPAFEGARADVQERLRDAGARTGITPGHRRIRNAFVIVEISLAVVLLAGAGLMLRSLLSLRHVNPGFNPDNILTVRTQMAPAKYGPEDKRIRFFREIEARTHELPGVRAVGIVSFLPFTGSARSDFTIEGAPPPAPGQSPVADVSTCDNGYFETLGLHIRSGRLFTDRELQQKSNVAIVNESLARTYFPGQDPIGKRVSVKFTPGAPVEIVGVIDDMRSHSLATAELPTIFWPYSRMPYGVMTITVATTNDPLSLATAVERVIRAIDKDQPVTDVRSMNQWIDQSLSQTRFSTVILIVFSCGALLLAGLGVYGVMAYAVTQRTTEVGIRIALGADSLRIVGLLLDEGIRLTVLGLIVGAALALALGRLIASQLYQVSHFDPTVFSVVTLTMGVLALTASVLPARRAMRIDPASALREG